jgi:hypothetical protein
MIIRLVAIAMYKTSVMIVSLSHLLLSNTVTGIILENLTLCEKNN